MFCSNCGKELRDDEKFCSQCGTSRGGSRMGDQIDFSKLFGAMEGSKGLVCTLKNNISERKILLFAAIAQFLGLFFMNIDAGVLRLVYEGGQPSVRMLLENMNLRKNIGLFEGAGLVKVLFLLANIVVVILLVYGLFANNGPQKAHLLFAAAVPALKLVWFGLVIAISKNTLLGRIADTLNAYTNKYISKSEIRGWFGSKMTFEGETWAFLAICVAALVLCVIALRQKIEEDNDEYLQEKEKQRDSFFMGTDTSYAEKLKREAEQKAKSYTRDGRRYVKCNACGHDQPEGAAFCQNCYTPLI